MEAYYFVTTICDSYNVALYNGNNGVRVKKLFW